jgi:hypothetical protein
VKQFQKLVSGVILFSLCVAAIASPNIVGKWKGKIEVDWSKAAGKMPPEQLAKLKKQLSSMKLSFEFRANKTFTATGSPRGPQSGSWNETGNQVELTTPQSKQQQSFALSKNGKTMTFTKMGATFTLTKI